MIKLKSWILALLCGGAILLGNLTTFSARADYPSIVLSLSPLDYWRFNETTNSPAANTVSNLGSAGAAATGYVLAGAITGQPGIVGNCVLFTNTGQNTLYDYTRIDIANLPALNPEPPFTVEFWAKPNSPFNPSDGTGLCPMSSLSPLPDIMPVGLARSGYLFYATPSSWAFRVGGERYVNYIAVATANVAVSTTSWTHVVGEFDGTNATIYINGLWAGSGTTNAADGGSFSPNQWVPTRIGGTSFAGLESTDVNGKISLLSGDRGWDGWVDEVAVYNTLLSSNTIYNHYTTATTNPGAYDALVLASSPVGYWNLDEPAYTVPSPSCTLAADTGSLGDLGTNTLGSQADQPGVPGLRNGEHSVLYSGVSGSLELSSNELPQDIGGKMVTLAAWIKPTTLGIGFAGAIIVQGYDATGDSYKENYLRMCDTHDWENNGNPDVTYYDVGTYNGGSQYNSAIYPVPPGDIGHWVFLVGTYDGTEWNLYRNGNLLAQFPDDSSGPTSLTDPWSVGSRSAPNPYFGMFFPGAIAEPAIFTNALNAATIIELYNSVGLPPVITQAPVAPSPAPVGSSATFSVWADGPGTLAYQWASNTVPVAGQTATNFTLTNLSIAASGTYSVVVTNAYGSVTSSVVLAVSGAGAPPVIETVNKSGNALTFTWSATASLMYQIQFTTILTPTGWTNVGGPLVATNSTMTTSGSNGPGYYRVVLLQ